MATCSKCGQDKPREAFPPQGGKICRACKVEASRAWRLANAERHRESMRLSQRRRRADPVKRAADAERDNARRRAANPRKGREFTTSCSRCGVEFSYEFVQKHRTVCDLCRQHDGDWKSFRLTGADAQALRERGECEICHIKQAGGRFNNWHIDHDHETGRVNGILCAKCNTAIGLLGDRPDLLVEAAKYLILHNRFGTFVPEEDVRGAMASLYAQSLQSFALGLLPRPE